MCVSIYHRTIVADIQLALALDKLLKFSLTNCFLFLATLFFQSHCRSPSRCFFFSEFTCLLILNSHCLLLLNVRNDIIPPPSLPLAASIQVWKLPAVDKVTLSINAAVARLVWLFSFTVIPLVGFHRLGDYLVPAEAGFPLIGFSESIEHPTFADHYLPQRGTWIHSQNYSPWHLVSFLINYPEPRLRFETGKLVFFRETRSFFFAFVVCLAKLTV